MHLLNEIQDILVINKVNVTPVDGLLGIFFLFHFEDMLQSINKPTSATKPYTVHFQQYWPKLKPIVMLPEFVPANINKSDFFKKLNKNKTTHVAAKLTWLKCC